MGVPDDAGRGDGGVERGAVGADAAPAAPGARARRAGVRRRARACAAAAAGAGAGAAGLLRRAGRAHTPTAAQL